MGLTNALFAAVFCTLLGGVLLQKGNAVSSFDCTRSGSSCGEFGICDEDNSECVCFDYYDGIYCQNNLNETEEVEVEECSVQCENEAVCLRSLSDGGDTLCQCQQGFYGENCESKTVSHTCSHDAITINIMPDVGQGTFEGLIYIDGQESDDACVLQSSGEDMPLTKTIQLDSCGEAQLISEDDGPDYYSFTVVTQYSAFIREITDERFTFTCEFRPAGSSIEGRTDLSSPGGKEEDKYNPPEEVSEVLQPFEVSLVNEDGSPLEGPTVQLGQILLIRVLLNGGKVYSSFRVETVTANNDVTGNKYLSLPLVEDSCPDLAPKGHVTEFYNGTADNMAGEEVPAAFLKFRVFRFLHSINVNFHLVIKVCEDDDNCMPLECDGNMYAGIGRRRRDVKSLSQSEADTETGSDIYREYDAGIIVLGGDDDINNQMQPVPPGGDGDQSVNKYCVTRVGLILSSLLLILLLLLAITTAVCACVRLLHLQQAPHDGIDNAAYCEKL